ncbi:MAG: hypothetical protein KBG39_01655 [Opitutaceae bacterium]|jgi:hypothetical protein|nr:hypothetical protein [Opitutaceae bacterium]MBP8961629.1 hypothetical protein [Opitutaceae bacterium]
MLYKLTQSSGARFEAIDPIAFEGFPKEKELEDLIAQNLWDVLFENNNLMPIRQERAWQPEADIYALNRQGDLVIFELKRDAAGNGAVHQALRYCEQASRYRYEKLEEMLRKYRKDDSLCLSKEHSVAFDLEPALPESQFNIRQRLVIIGTAGDTELIRNVEYWRSRGLPVDFIPYRIYRIGGESFFEFFSLPYDQHSNPGDAKGVIFDTNRSYDEEAIWYMCEHSRVAAFGGIQGIVHSFNKGDIVFLYHKGSGIVAVGKVKSDVKADEVKDALYRDLQWMTPVPRKGAELRAMSAAQIKDTMGFNFWWAKTMKPPFLNKEESLKLLGALKAILA